MSKRPSRPSDAGPSKKRAKKNHTFGAPTADDEDFLLSQLSAPTAKALSTRHTSTGVPPSLVNICARNFVTNLRFLFESHREETQQWLKLLPERLVPGVFAMLSSAHPTLMSHPFITAVCPSSFKNFLCMTGHIYESIFSVVTQLFCRVVVFLRIPYILWQPSQTLLRKCVCWTWTKYRTIILLDYSKLATFLA